MPAVLERSLSDGALLEWMNLDQSTSVVLQSTAPRPAFASDSGFKLVSRGSPALGFPLVQAAKQINQAMRSVHPLPISDGMGGSYLMMTTPKFGGKPRPLGVFKPLNEEPGAPQNPKGYRTIHGCACVLPRAVIQAIPPGEAAVREVVAYWIDTQFGSRPAYAGVPPTCFAMSRSPKYCYGKGASAHDKLGSFQLYCENDGSTTDLGPSLFDESHVRRIALFDLRVLNLDRHGGNILVRRHESQGLATLIPIDHGYILPEDIVSPTAFEWMWWPQVAKPFTQEELDYIRSLDTESDIRMLKSLLRLDSATSSEDTWWEGACRTLRVCTALLQKGAEAGLTLRDIASAVTSGYVDSESALQKQWRSVVASVRNRLAPTSPASFTTLEESDVEDGDPNSAVFGDDDIPDDTAVEFLELCSEEMLSQMDNFVSSLCKKKK